MVNQQCDVAIEANKLRPAIGLLALARPGDDSLAHADHCVVTSAGPWYNCSSSWQHLMAGAG